MRKLMLPVLAVSLCCREAPQQGPSTTSIQGSAKPAATRRAPPTALPKVEWSLEPSSFRNVPFGTSEADAKKIVKMYSCFGQGPRFCMAEGLEIGNARVGASTFLFDGGRFVEAFFKLNPDKFQEIRDVFVEKYGPPISDTRETVTNRMNAQFQNETLVWVGPSVSIQLQRYYEKVTEGLATFTTNEYLKKLNAESEAKRKKAASAF